MKKRMLTVILILTIVMNIPGVVSAKELQSPSGFQCQVLTASVKVPSSPYDSFRVGSGYSSHQYRDSRYKPVDHFLKWNLEN